MDKRIAVILSGCGFYDGAEVQETVLTLLRLDQRGATTQCFAPNIGQLQVINHATGEFMDEKRNVLVESARIVRGAIKDLRQATADDFDALIMPGGFGVAKNLSNFAIKGPQCTIQPDVLALARAFANAGKPVGLMCISPILTTAIYGRGAICTIGSDAQTVSQFKKMGAGHRECPVEEIIVDSAHKLVTTPAFMGSKTISEVAEGINKLVDRVLEMITDSGPASPGRSA